MSRSNSQAPSRSGSLSGRAATQTRSLATWLEEAETNLVAKQEANALLNSQVDILTKQLQELQAGKAAYEKHVKDLTALLTKERRKNSPEQAVETSTAELPTDEPSLLEASTAGRDEAGWVVNERWEELRKLGQAAGWLVSHDQVLQPPTSHLAESVCCSRPQLVDWAGTVNAGILAP